MPPPDLSRAESLERWLAAVQAWLSDVEGESGVTSAARRAGFSASHLRNLLGGRRPLLLRHVGPLSRALELSAGQTELLATLVAGGPRPSPAPRPSRLGAQADHPGLAGVASNRALLRSALPGAWAVRAWVWTRDTTSARALFAAGDAALRTRTSVQNRTQLRIILRAFPVTLIDGDASANADFPASTALISTPGGATVKTAMHSTPARFDEPHVLDFLDYRDFLARALEAAQERNHRLGYAWLAQRLGVTDAHVANILARRRKLDRSRAASAAQQLGLSGDEADYFQLLVAYNDSTDRLEAISAWRELCLLRARHGRPLEAGAGSILLLRWYMPVILELAMQEGGRVDAAWIASRVQPPISEAEAADGLALLLASGLLSGHSDGTQRVAHTPQWLDAALLARFHDECLDVAAETARQGLEPWQVAEFEIPAADGAFACADALLAWRDAIAVAAADGQPSTPSQAPAHLFLAHAFLVGTPPP